MDIQYKYNNAFPNLKFVLEPVSLEKALQSTNIRWPKYLNLDDIFARRGFDWHLIGILIQIQLVFFESQIQQPRV